MNSGIFPFLTTDCIIIIPLYDRNGYRCASRPPPDRLPVQKQLPLIRI